MKIDPLDKRLEAFGARVFKLYGHNINELASRAELRPDGRVLVILAETDPCQGLSLLSANSPKLHYLRFKSEEEKAKYEEALKGMVE
jgi:transketolase